MPNEGKKAGLWLDWGSGLLAGGLLAVGTGLGVMAGLAWLILRGVLTADWVGRAALAGSFLGCLAGGGYCVFQVRSRVLLAGLGVSLLYCLLWAVAACFLLDGGGVAPAAAVSALLGGCVCGLWAAFWKKKRK